MSIESNLVGAIAEVRVGNFDRNMVDAIDLQSKVVARGEIRAVGMLDNGNLVVWIEALDPAEYACWFGESKVEGYVDHYPGQVVQVVLGIFDIPTSGNAVASRIWNLHVIRSQVRST